MNSTRYSRLLAALGLMLIAMAPAVMAQEAAPAPSAPVPASPPVPSAPSPSPAPTLALEDPSDPFETVNRITFQFNRGVDWLIFKPLAHGYKATTSGPMRQAVSNMLNNLEEPLNFVNLLLQGKVGKAATAVGRLAVNSTLGFAGAADLASHWGLPDQEEDFGQTFATWGWQNSTYLMLPLLGPSNLRDMVGLGVQTVGDPMAYGFHASGVNELPWAERGARILNARTRALDTVDKLLDDSADPYVALRSAYQQRRTFLINDGDLPPLDPTTQDPFADLDSSTGPGE